MTEDIVTRLRAVAALQPGDTLDKIGWPNEDWGPLMHSLVVDAAAEIERLRHQCDAVVRIAEASIGITKDMQKIFEELKP